MITEWKSSKIPWHTSMSIIRKNSISTTWPGRAGMNDQYFCRFFKKSIGRSPMVYINEFRIRQAMHFLEDTDESVTEVAMECGYNNLGNFLREFHRQTGTTPLKYRKNSQNKKKSLTNI